MEQSASFSGKEVDRISLDFTKLREQGLEYIQELSGEVWTDYNSHDPGVTILEQLCYSITDLAVRTSLPVEDLLTTHNKDVPLNFRKNGFSLPQNILSSHPVTLNDTRKLILDHFDKIQNVWIKISETRAFEEAVNGINRIEIVPKIDFLNAINASTTEKDKFLNEVNLFLSENRNIGERFESAHLLEAQDISISFKVILKEDTDLERTIAQVFIQLLEYIYTPVQFYSLHEMQKSGAGMEDIFAGPKMSSGFLRNDFPDKQLKLIHIDELQKILTKVEGLIRCEVYPFDNNQQEINVEPGKFFHVLQTDQVSNLLDNRFDRIYQHMSVSINGKELPVYILNKQRINSIFSEIWMKKHRSFPLENSMNELLKSLKKGSYRNPGEYYSMQRHFPLIYGIGEAGLSSNDPPERHAKANQLKAYLVLFEQHLANHLAQLGNLNEFFNINYENGNGKTYFTQKPESVPGLNRLITDQECALESESTFFDRKNRIYNHQLARFGEEFSDIPWKIALRLNLLSDEEEYNRALLQHKSNYLQNLESLSYFRTRGEYLITEKTEANEVNYQRIPSGLEELILAKSGIRQRKNRRLLPSFIDFSQEADDNIDDQFFGEVDNRVLGSIQLISSEISDSEQKTDILKIAEVLSKELELKVLYKEAVELNSYRISELQSPEEKVQVLFQKQQDKWINLLSSPTKEKALEQITLIRNYFLDQNKKSEGLYLIDHILLSDILKDSKFGFKLIDFNETSDSNDTKQSDSSNFSLFQTIEAQSWSDTEKERDERISQFYELGISASNYRLIDKNWTIQNKQEIILVSCEPGVHNRGTGEDEKNRLFRKTRNAIQFFDSREESNGRLRFGEVEKIRAQGSLSIKEYHYGQRRLVYQRKLWNGEIVDEDFFNLMISVLLPDWPALFQIERYQHYITDLIHERVPSHIHTQIRWIDAPTLRIFEDRYYAWEALRAKTANDETLQNELRSAAWDVYKTIMELKTD